MDMTLYALTDALTQFKDAVDNGDIPEEAIADTLESLELPYDEKLDNTAVVYKNYLAQAAAIDNEIAALSQRKTSAQNKANGIKKWMLESMQAVGKEKLETARNKLSVRKSPPSVHILDESSFLDWAKNGHQEFLTIKDPVLNRTAIKDALKAGNEIEGAELTQGKNLQIK